MPVGQSTTDVHLKALNYSDWMAVIEISQGRGGKEQGKQAEQGRKVG